MDTKVMFSNKTIVADPPWKYGKWGVGSEKSAFSEKHNETEIPIPYETMSVEEIKALNVAGLADENCELYLWTTQKYLPDAFEVLKAWGFKYCQTLTWCKTPMGTGQGGVYCPTTEFLILGRKGKMPKVERIDTTWWEVKRQMKHSKKPEFFQDLIEQVSEAQDLKCLQGVNVKDGMFSVTRSTTPLIWNGIVAMAHNGLQLTEVAAFKNF